MNVQNWANAEMFLQGKLTKLTTPFKSHALRDIANSTARTMV